jgi:hypothetical protein
VAQSRLTKEERALLLSFVEKAHLEIRASPPEEIEPVKSIFLIYRPSSQRPSICFAPEHCALGGPGRVVEVRPEDVETFAEAHALTRREPKQLFKLYQRIDGRLHYREAWVGKTEIVEHWGECGTKGQTRRHPISGDGQAEELLQKLQKDARAGGYRPIPPSRHQTLVAEYPIDGFGDENDLSFRHAAEDFLDNHLGWLGFGHCDGGSTGGNTMEVFCKVVDYDGAKAALESDLPGSRFGTFSRIYCLQ